MNYLEDIFWEIYFRISKHGSKVWCWVATNYSTNCDVVVPKSGATTVGGIRRLSSCRGIAVATIFVFSDNVVSADFLGLGDLPGGITNSRAESVSLDGATVVGVSTSSIGTEAFIWSAETGIVGLGDLPGGSDYSVANAVNGNGSVVVGQSNGVNGFEAFRWTQATGMVGLGYLAGGSGWGLARGIDASGSIIVGESSNGVGIEAFRWTQDTGMVGLGYLSGGSGWSTASAISADGQVVVGESSSATGHEAFRWTQATGMVGLGDLAGGVYWSTANAVNKDGSVIVGESSSGLGSEAFRWTSTSGIVGLGDLPGGSYYSRAEGVSADGRVVVGVSNGMAGNEAFRWTADHGMQSVVDWLNAQGLSVSGWHLDAARGVNADGSVVVGLGTNPHGDTEAWIARSGSGLIGTDNYTGSLSSTIAVSTLAVQGTNLFLHGLRGDPVRYRHGQGNFCSWIAGDWGRDKHSERDGTLGLAELGGCWRPSSSLYFSAALANSWFSQSFYPASGVDSSAVLLSLEGQIRLSNMEKGPVWLTMTGVWGSGDATVNRGYLNAGSLVVSQGETNLSSFAFRARLDWEGVFSVYRTEMTPHIEFSTIKQRVNSYKESGGGFPAWFDALVESVHELRIGLDANHKYSDHTIFYGGLEGVYRWEERGPATTGQVIGLFSFDLEGHPYDRTWLHAKMGVEQSLSQGVVRLAVNGTTQGETPTWWFNVGYQIGF